MNREHDTIEEGHPACQEEEFLEFPLLSSRHLAALKGGYPDVQLGADQLRVPYVQVNTAINALFRDGIDWRDSSEYHRISDRRCRRGEHLLPGSRAADAPALLLLHGFPSASHMFRDLIPLLADRFHVVAPDLPGFGQSDMPARTNSTTRSTTSPG